MSRPRLTPEQAEQILLILKQTAESEFRDLAALSASKPDRQLLGQLEYEVRDRVHKIGVRRPRPQSTCGGKGGALGRARVLPAAPTTARFVGRRRRVLSGFAQAAESKTATVVMIYNPVPEPKEQWTRPTVTRRRSAGGAPPPESPGVPSPPKSSTQTPTRRAFDRLNHLHHKNSSSFELLISYRNTPPCILGWNPSPAGVVRIPHEAGQAPPDRDRSPWGMVMTGSWSFGRDPGRPWRRETTGIKPW